MFCSSCGAETDLKAKFCANCGALQPGFPEPPAAIPAALATLTPAVAGFPPQVDERGRRVIAFFIDVIPLRMLAIVHLLPIIGWIFYGFAHACYWLLRDYTGSSLGKMALGSYVTREDGSPASTQQRILRNVTLAIPGVIGMIPVIGIVFEVFFAALIFGIEAVLLLATGRRLGDHIAGTTVYRKGVTL
jgi:uncharacterized RDD family membrane protein YckC